MECRATASQIVQKLSRKGIDCCEKTLKNKIREKFDLNFKEYKGTVFGTTVLKLQQKAIMMGLEGNVPMLIFCLKNLCGWSDKQESADSAQDVIVKVDGDDVKLR